MDVKDGRDGILLVDYVEYIVFCIFGRYVLREVIIFYEVII